MNFYHEKKGVALILNIDNNFVERLKKIIINSYQESLNLDKNIKNKELNDIVTNVDIYMEEKIINQLLEWFPKYSIYSEEKGKINNDSEYVWYIDPIDGTINFAAGIPLFGTSIALKKNNETIFGFIYDYNQNDTYYAFKGKGAYCNDKKLKVSDHSNLKDSMISFCLTSHYSDKYIKEVLNVEEKIASKVRGLRLIVSSAIELCWLASGKIDGFINVKPSMGLSSTAGILLVEESGGKVTNIEGKSMKKIDNKLISNGKIHDELVNILK